MNKRLLFLPMTLLLFSTASNAQTVDRAGHGIQLEYMDQSVKPGDDFFRYVNGSWFDKAQIPDDRNRWGSFDELRQNTDQDVLAILKNAADNKELDPNSDQMK